MLILCSWYLIPLLRWGLRPLGPRTLAPRLRQAMGWIGRIEWALHLVRDTVGLVFFLGMGGYWIVAGLQARGRPAHLFMLIAPDSMLTLGALFAGLAVLSLLVWRDEHRRRVQLLALAARTPYCAPHDFFGWYFASHGPLPLALPSAAAAMTGDAFDARHGARPVRGYTPFLQTLVSTYFMSCLVLLAARQRHAESRACVDGLMAIWGARIVQLCRGRVQVEGAEQLAHLQGPVIVCSNHQSALDFVVTPVALALASGQAARPLHVRYLAARDHFIDNWLVRRVLRMGDAMDRAGMVFVHRRGDAVQRRQSIADAVERMIARGVDVVVYPQGTRAPARAADLAALEPGYITAGGVRRALTPGAHLKAGAARIALLALRAQPTVTIVPLAVLGTGRVLPRDGVRVLTGQTMTVRIGAPIVLCAESLPTERDIMQQLDSALQQAGGLEAQLLQLLPAAVRPVVQQRLAAHPHRAVLLAALDACGQVPAEARVALLAAWQHGVECPPDAAAVEALYRQVITAWREQTV